MVRASRLTLQLLKRRRISTWQREVLLLLVYLSKPEMLSHQQVLCQLMQVVTALDLSTLTQAL
jgi:hypothetical protein